MDLEVADGRRLVEHLGVRALDLDARRVRVGVGHDVGHGGRLEALVGARARVHADDVERAGLRRPGATFP